jgi:hypothetical protein
MRRQGEQQDPMRHKGEQPEQTRRGGEQYDPLHRPSEPPQRRDRSDEESGQPVQLDRERGTQTGREEGSKAK